MTSASEKFNGVNVLIFDLDGTLIDSKLDLALSVNAMLKHMAARLKLTKPSTASSAMAPRRLSAAPSATPLPMPKSKPRWPISSATIANTCSTTPFSIRACSSVCKTLRYILWPCSPTSRSLQRSDYRRPRHLTLLPLRLWRQQLREEKTGSHGVETLLRDFKAAPKQAMIIGDSEVDVQTARNAGTWACGVTYGLGSDGLPQCAPDLLLDSLTELPPILNGGIL